MERLTFDPPRRRLAAPEVRFPEELGDALQSPVSYERGPPPFLKMRSALVLDDVAAHVPSPRHGPAGFRVLPPVASPASAAPATEGSSRMIKSPRIPASPRVTGQEAPAPRTTFWPAAQLPTSAGPTQRDTVVPPRRRRSLRIATGAQPSAIPVAPPPCAASSVEVVAERLAAAALKSVSSPRPPASSPRTHRRLRHASPEDPVHAGTWTSPEEDLQAVRDRIHQAVRTKALQSPRKAVEQCALAARTEYDPTVQGWMKKHGRGVEVEELQSKMKILRQWFEFLDTDGSGEIGISELEEPLLSVGFAKTREDVIALVSAVDEDANGEIDFDEFVDLLSSRRGLGARVFAGNAAIGKPTASAASLAPRPAHLTREEMDKGRHPVVKLFRDLTVGKFGDASLPFRLLITQYRRHQLMNAGMADDPQLRRQGLEILYALKLAAQRQAVEEGQHTE